mgnify:FL=1
MYVFPAKESVGIVLPMLITGDLFAIIYYRRNVVWKHIITLLPWVFIGLIVGYFLLDVISDSQLKPIIGGLVLILIILQVSREKFGEKFNEKLPKSTWFTLFMGILAGFTTMIGNAAGSIMAIYLLVKGLPKRDFIGTGAWYFIIVNLIKVPFYIHLGLITVDSITLNLWLIPTILIGAFIGIALIKRIPQHIFQALILVFAACGAFGLIFF